MPSNPHKPGRSASNSFSAEEIEVMNLIVRTLLKGGGRNDLTHLARNPAFHTLSQKFARMREKINAAALSEESFEPPKE